MDTKPKWITGSPAAPPAKAIVQTDANHTVPCTMGSDGVYIECHGGPPASSATTWRAAQAREVGRFVDGNGVPAWIPQCAVYEPEENAIYFGMQQLVGELKLWRVPLGGGEAPASFSSGTLLDASPTQGDAATLRRKRARD